MSQVVASYSDAGADNGITVAGVNQYWKYGQTFSVPMFCKPVDVVFKVKRTGSPNKLASSGIQEVTSGYGTSATVIGGSTYYGNDVNENTFPTSYGDVSFPIYGDGDSDLILSPYKKYVVFSEFQSQDFSNYVSILTDDTSPSHDGTAVHKFSGESSLLADTSVDVPFTLNANALPMPSYTTDTSSGVAPFTVTFTDTSLYSPTSWTWDFGDGNTSTLQNPTHTYTNPGKYTVKLTARNAYGGVIRTDAEAINATGLIAPDSLGDLALTINEPTITKTDPPPPPATDWSALGKEDEKVFVYKVYTHSGTYIGTWDKDVIDDLQYTQRLNTAGTTTTVRLARSANTKKEVRDVRITEDGLDTRITESGDTRSVTYETNNTVGEDTDVDLNYNVDIYVHYGEFADRITEDGDVRITEDGDTRVVAEGAPLGVRIFSGYVLDYESVYGANAGVTVTLASHGVELSNEIIRSGSTTTVPYTTTELATIAKSILDTNPGKITYDPASIENTGVSETLKFRLNTKLEGLETIYDQTPSGWYWYVNVAENLFYLKPVNTDCDHTFIIGQHIKELRIKRTIEDLKNAIWFVGGETTQGDPATTKYKYYDDVTSIATWRKGIERITDRRYTVDASMQRRADKIKARYKDPIYTTTVTISSAKYDIESIKLGQTVCFRNFDNFIDAIPPLQIVSLSYTPTAVTLELGELQMRQSDHVIDAEESIANEQYSAIPNAPA